MVYRVYVSKKRQYASEDAALLQDIKENLGIGELEDLQSFNRYDVEGVDGETFASCVKNILSEPQIDQCFDQVEIDSNTFAVEYLPGQFDQRSDSAEQCIQFLTGGERPIVHAVRVYKLKGNITPNQLKRVQEHIVNPVECRVAEHIVPKTLKVKYPKPPKTQVIKGFTTMKKEGYQDFIKEQGLAMDVDDLGYCQAYFKDEEGRNPTITELKMIDTYWSDHCRHTTFSTVIDDVSIEHKAVSKSFEKYKEVKSQLYPKGDRPTTLMDLATIGAKYLKHTGKLRDTDDSEEINACSVKVTVDAGGKPQKWLLMFKNETHNHPTEIEPFGGAATCLGGAIRDPLSGRSYVYQAMRVTGAGNPLAPVSDTIKGKLPQSKICQTAAAGYSSYGNQIGLATGHVAEVYHKGFVAKRLETGAVIGATLARNVVRETPLPGDIVILLGGATGRDGCGGATGSSKAHDTGSLESCGAEVQKGNPPEERKIQRLFRSGRTTRLIKRCNDFGAGGISVAIGELADGLDINLDVVPKKYEGLSGTELAISESQERMAVVVAPENAEKFIRAAEKENLSAVIVATVTDKNRLEMTWQGDKIVSLSREFLNSAGAVKHTNVKIMQDSLSQPVVEDSVVDRFNFTMASLNVASQRGLVERFDSTIGAGTILMPFGGKHQTTPTQAMAALLPVKGAETSTCSVMAYGYDPYLAEQSPYYGAYYAVVSSVAKVLAAGGDLKKAWLTFQEYFERLKKEPVRWGKPVAALLGAFEAQMALELGAIGGKDSMSGTFEKIDVPPTLISFAVSATNATNIISPEFKEIDSKVYLIQPEMGENGLYDPESLLKTYRLVQKAIENKRIISAWAVGPGGVAEAVTKMGFGNKIGIKIADMTADELFAKCYGGIVVEADGVLRFGRRIGITSASYHIYADGEIIDMNKLEHENSETLEPVYKTSANTEVKQLEKVNFHFKGERLAPIIKKPVPTVLIPVFPGTNCEYDTARAFERQGANVNVLVIKNRRPEDILESAQALAAAIKKSQIIALPGGFSGGDEPDGSAKFIVSLLRNPLVADQITNLLEIRDGLMCGICNGFQALVKLGLVPYGKITKVSETAPTLSYNQISRHQSRLVHTRVASNKSPWLMFHEVGDINTIAVSHGEGRFIATEQELERMIKNGQIATQYVDLLGQPTTDILFNPNNSVLAIEGITSPDGRVFGKMGHSERYGKHLYKNIPDLQSIQYKGKEQQIFKGAVEYFK